MNNEELKRGSLSKKALAALDHADRYLVAMGGRKPSAIHLNSAQYEAVLTSHNAHLTRDLRLPPVRRVTYHGIPLEKHNG